MSSSISTSINSRLTPTVDLTVLVRRLKALSNEHRLKIYLKILEYEQAHPADTQSFCLISDIADECCKLGAPTISHHIKILEAAGLINIHKQGKFIGAKINQDAQQMAMHAFHVRPDVL